MNSQHAYVFKPDENSLDLQRFIMHAFNGSRNVFKAHTSNDRCGIDFWVEQNRSCLRIEIKQSSNDFRDFLPIEWVSQKEFNKPGWTVDSSKATDFVMWKFANRTAVVLPFHWLCFCAVANMDKWKRDYPPRIQKTKGLYGDIWSSEFSWVPYKRIFRDLYEYSCRLIDE